MFVLDTQIAHTIFGENNLPGIETIRPDPNVDAVYYVADSLSDILSSIDGVINKITGDSYCILILPHNDNSVKVVFYGSLDTSFADFYNNLGALESLWNFGVDIDNIYIIDSMHFFNIAMYPYHKDSGYESPVKFDDKFFTSHVYSIISRDANLLTMRLLYNPNIKGDYVNVSPTDILVQAIPIDPNLSRETIFSIYIMSLYAFINTIPSLVRLDNLRSIACNKADSDVLDDLAKFE